MRPNSRNREKEHGLHQFYLKSSFPFLSFFFFDGLQVNVARGDFAGVEGEVARARGKRDVRTAQAFQLLNSCLDLPHT